MIDEFAPVIERNDLDALRQPGLKRRDLGFHVLDDLPAHSRRTG